MDKTAVFQRENQRVSASDILGALAKGEDIRVFKCVISGNLDINRLFRKEEGFDVSDMMLETEHGRTVATFTQSIMFNSCSFEEDVCFCSGWEDDSSLKTVFKREVVFNSSVFQGQGLFLDVHFNAAAFDGCRFERICAFRKSVFNGNVMFRTVHFGGYALFSSAIFNSQVRFNNTCFAKGANFSDVKFGGSVEFSGCYSLGRSIPVYERIFFSGSKCGQEETFWRFVKQSAQQAGHYNLAGESFYREKCADFKKKLRGLDYNNMSFGKRMVRLFLGLRLLPEFVFGRLLFGYGERPVRVLITSCIIMVVCAFFYISDHAGLLFRGEPIALSSRSFMEAMYFSVTTFATLGFGDMYPGRTDVLTRGVVMFESVSGAALMALFIVCLAKRFSRN